MLGKEVEQRDYVSSSAVAEVLRPTNGIAFVVLETTTEYFPDYQTDNPCNSDSESVLRVIYSFLGGEFGRVFDQDLSNHETQQCDEDES